MAPGQPYFGPISMAESRYAAPHRKREVEALLASNPELKARKDTGHILATWGQIVAASNPEHAQSTGVQLAQAQDKALKEEIAQHTRNVDHTLFTAVANTRQILNMISDAMKKERPDTADASLKVVDNLWQELNKLFEATRKAHEALPAFLEKQKESVNLIAGAKVQDAYRDLQQELDQKDKKIKLGNEVILGQQQAYKDVEANTNNKNSELQERLARTQMEQSLLRQELDMVKSQLLKAHEAEQAAAKAKEELEKQVTILSSSNKSLAAEKLDIGGAVSDLEAKLKAAEEKATQYYEKEFRSMTEQLQKEQQKATALETQLKALRCADKAAKKEFEKVKSELKLLSDKYKNQSGVYAKVSEDLKKQTKKAQALDIEVRDVQQKQSQVEKERDRVTWLKDTLQKQHNTLKAELDDLKNESVLVKEEAEQLSMKLKRVENENNELETENNDLRTKRDHYVAALKAADAELATLRTTVKDLQGSHAIVSETGDARSLEKELKELRGELARSETNRSEWEQLGRKAMEQYREVLPKYKHLEKQILNAQDSSGTTNDAKYWREKYNELLAETEME